MSVRLLYIVSHPIQYQAPLLRLIAATEGIRLRVLFEHTASEGVHFDPGFGREIAWDVPLRDGYDNVAAAETDLKREIGGADVVWMHGWQGIFMGRALRMARQLGKPVLMRGENWDGAMPDGSGLRGWLKRRYLAWIFRHCRGFLCIGAANRAYYRRHGIPDDRLFDMPYAIDNDAFAARAAAADTVALRRELGLPEDSRVLLYAGKLSRRKHPDVLLAAWQQADWQGSRPALLFVGDGEMAAELRQSSEGLEDVVFAGFRNQGELPGFYALADIFVLAASAEAWGLAINEAMACGTGVIASTECGAAADLVGPDTGYAVRPDDAAALAYILPFAIDRAAELGDGARRRIAGWNFTADIAGLKQALEIVA